MIYKNKRAWIRIVEAFVAILLITGVVLVIIDKGYVEKEDISERIYKIQISILREIQQDKNLRESIVGIDENELPVEMYDENFPADVLMKVEERVPSYLSCNAKICKQDDVCKLDQKLDKDTYAQSVLISDFISVGESIEYSAKKLNLFCWVD